MSEGVNILVVDDRPEGLLTLKAVIDDPTYNIICASSGTEALRLVLNYDFAVILMDVQMSGMDGFETAKLIKQRRKSKDIPLIFVTAIDKADQFISKGYLAGAVDYMFKPFDPSILKFKVAIFVDLYLKNRKIIEQAAQLHELEKRETEKALLELEIESRRRYQSLADAVPQILWRTDRGGVPEYFNRFWYSYSGLSLHQSLIMPWESVIHAEDFLVLNEGWRVALEDKAGFEIEARLRSAHSNEYRWHLVRVLPEFDNYSELVSWIGTATDIHDQKLFQNHLIRARDAADSASETKSRFLANMSHEIRTPLGAVLGFTDLILNNDLNTEKRAEYMNIIRRNSEQLSKIIDEILDISKIEAGTLEVETTCLNLPEFLSDLKSLMMLPAKEKGLTLTFDLKTPIPKMILTDITRLRQILFNVIGNGIKFSTQGEIEVSIAMSQIDGESGLAIEVSDTGPGLTAEQIKNLFKPFSQVDSSLSRKFGGTGLGLALSRDFARALGGDVSVEESAPHTGCKFLISVKTGSLQDIAFVESIDVSVEIAAPLKVKANSLKLDGINVLFVDDSEDNQKLISHFLKHAGAHVDLASNGQEGFDRAMAGNYNVILMDVQMPVLDGYLATSQLRKNGYKKPIIALTAHAMKDERQKCIKMGCNDYMTKPLNRSLLVENIFNYAQITY